MELDSRKKSRRDRMMRSKSFEMQRKRDRPEGSRRVERLFFHRMDGNNRNVFRIEGKECKDQERVKMCRRSMPERGRCFCMGWVTLSRPVAVDEERIVAAARNSTGENGEQKDE